MTVLVKTVRFIIWMVVLALTTIMAGVCLFAAYKVVSTTEWGTFIEILKTLGLLFLLIVLTFIAGGFVLWAIREHVLPLSPEETKDKNPQEK